jgi:thioredoxin reductase
MSASLEAIIVGAGPFALSLGSHFEKAGIDYCIYGDVMGAWKKAMPPGMMLKSWPCSSNIDDPDGEFTLKQFCIERGVAYDDLFMPLPLELFCAYGDAFAERFKLKTKAKTLVRLRKEEDGFVATFDDGDVAYAPNVILALGVHPFKSIPPVFADLPGELISHSGDYGPVDGLKGQKVAVVGAGASASGLAALLSEAGASPTLIAREEELHFADPPQREKPTLFHSLSDLVFRGRFECAGVGGGSLMHLWGRAPVTFHMLPEATRLRIARTSLGPSGHCLMKDRVLSAVPLRLGRSVEKAYERDGKAVLELRGRDGTLESFEADHVVAATGFRTSLARLPFFDAELRTAISTSDETPVLTRNYETSAKGLFFVGPATADSFGPVMRFVVGSQFSSRAVTRRIERTRGLKPKTHLRPVEAAGRAP